MFNRKFTENDYKAFERFITAKTNSEVVDRSNVPLIREIAKVIDAIRMFAPNMPKGDEWLESWSFTFANKVMIAKIDDPLARACTLAHECQHSLQWHKRTPQADVPEHFHMQWLYLVEPEARVRLEVEAYRAGFELEHFLTDNLRSSSEVETILEGGYMISRELGEFAHRLYAPSEVAMSQGIYSTEVARESIRFFREQTDLL